MLSTLVDRWAEADPTALRLRRRYGIPVAQEWPFGVRRPLVFTPESCSSFLDQGHSRFERPRRKPYLLSRDQPSLVLETEGSHLTEPGGEHALNLVSVRGGLCVALRLPHQMAKRLRFWASVSRLSRASQGEAFGDLDPWFSLRFPTPASVGTPSFRSGVMLIRNICAGSRPRGRRRWGENRPQAAHGGPGATPRAGDGGAPSGDPDPGSRRTRPRNSGSAVRAPRGRPVQRGMSHSVSSSREHEILPRHEVLTSRPPPRHSAS
ncbi:hypothetical protein H1C71_018041 [Ictidomys tridecemlineatus]|nr:hypothetical protein H1C71_018041 [Ictidomys tridecemlineatus]